MTRKERSQLPAQFLRIGKGLPVAESVDAQAVQSLASILGRKWAPRLRVVGVPVPPESSMDFATACSLLDVDWRDVERHFLSEFP